MDGECLGSADSSLAIADWRSANALGDLGLSKPGFGAGPEHFIEEMRILRRTRRTPP